MTNTLFSTAERCFRITESYLSIPVENDTIRATKNAILQTKQYILKDVFSKWDPGSGEIAFSYNGGKDCQVLLIIYLSCLYEFYSCPGHEEVTKFKLDNELAHSVSAVYINGGQTFKTLENFVKATVGRYSLAFYEFPPDLQRSMPAAFQHYLDTHPKVKAVVLGVRRTDPFAMNLERIQKTDDGWPNFYRIQTLLHWKLANIWSFLLYSGEEFCGLYSIGYTSIGCINTTARNKHLRAPHDDEGPELVNQFTWEISHAYGKHEPNNHVKTSAISELDLEHINKDDDCSYYPGWYLTNDSWERAGRLVKGA